MKRLLSILLALSPFAFSLSPLQAQDFSRMSERSIMGTARYVGMSGAMTAIGGDPSACLDNPAGLGLYRRFEVMVTMDWMFDRTHQRTPGDKIHPTQANMFMVPQASFVFSLPTYNPDDHGVQFHNLLFSYQRVHTFNRLYIASADNDPSLGALLATAQNVNWDIPFCSERYNLADQMRLQEAGYVNEYAFDYAMNIKNQWYVGVGLRLQSYWMSADARYDEFFSSTSLGGTPYANSNKTTLLYKGVTAHLAAGLICRPLSWLRLGVGFQTPTIGSLTTYYTGTLTAQTDSLRNSYGPDANNLDRRFHMPLQLSTSVAFQLTAYGMLSFQYDYRHGQYYGGDSHSLRAGLEIIPVMGMYINAGYAYESAFLRNPGSVSMDPYFERQDTYFFQPRTTQYASCAIGYRGTYMMVQAAYQYRWQNSTLYAHENIIDPYNMHSDTHRLVITIGWHSD